MADDPSDAPDLDYIINHVFCPPKLPQKDDSSIKHDQELCALVLQCALEFRDVLSREAAFRWDAIIKMLDQLCDSNRFHTLSTHLINDQICSMDCSDFVVYLIRAQNAAIILRKSDSEVTFELFEVSPTAAAVIGTKGKLLCSYPGPAIAVPSDIVDDPDFSQELASFLSQMNEDTLDAAPTTTKARSTVVEERETTNPRYITELLTGILRGIGRPTEVSRITKRIRDEVLWGRAPLPWRRSPLWLVIRVALQTTLEHEVDGPAAYKSFMVFFMTKILALGVESELPSDLLYCMRAKVCRRLYKLASTAPQFLLDMVKQTTEQVQQILQERWDLVQNAQTESSHWAPEELDIEEDTHLSLINSHPYLMRVLLDQASPSPQSFWQPQDHPRRHDISEFLLINGECSLSSSSEADSYIALADFESSVRTGIDRWVSQVSPSTHGSACVAIYQCMNQYSKQAQILYKDNPEDISIMFLTLLELWVALDKVAIMEHKMLAGYSPEIPSNLPDSLLIRKADSMARLDRIQKYLSLRHSQSSVSRSVFMEKVNSDAFAIRFFDSSETHILLKERIELDAMQEREKKVKELEQKNARHTSLSNEARQLQHAIEMDKHGRGIHAKSCKKCKLEKQVRKMKIGVHEWPLPKDPSQAKIVVFELDCPIAFSAWRSATYSFLVDVCTPTKDRPSAISPHTTLANYSALSKYATQPMNHRLSLASTSKPFSKSHYRNVGIPSTEGKACVNSGLSFKLYDKTGDSWATKSFAHCNHIARYCTFLLPPGPYLNLQFAVAETSHTQNEVIAKQSDCHQDLNIHEYIAFGSLRSGPLLQWLNIIREIRARSLSFRREEVCALITQAAWQVGPLSSTGQREWHEELGNDAFGHALLGELEGLMASIEGNWLEYVSMRIIIILACRLLTSTTGEEVEERIFALLRNIRTVTFSCVRQLSEKLQEAEDDAESFEFQQRVRDMAATCRATYDVEICYLPYLFSSPEDDNIFVQCAVILYDNLPPKLDEVPTDSKVLLGRDRRFSHALQNIISQRVDENGTGFNRAIASAWPAYRPGSSWQRLQYPNDCWLTSTTAEDGGQQPQRIHYNTLEGRLLIDGKPLGRLPLDFIQHPTYHLIFGQRILDVIPADMSGMEFATRGFIFDYRIYFAMKNDGSELVIRATKDAQIFELIPPKLFMGDLPKLLVEGHTHWMNIATREIEIRPVKHMWDSAQGNWRIHFSTAGQSSMLRIGNDARYSLVDVCSPSYQMVSNRLSPLEYPEYHIITARFDGSEYTLSADLPRFGLSFFVNDDNHLQCRNIRGMVVDLDQSTGTLIGLRNQLVLRPGNMAFTQLPRPRSIIIAQGQLSISSIDHHVRIDIDTQHQSRVQFHLYKIDTDLGCLIGNVNLTNKLYKAYLHAVSSHCLPDPLTGRTGTEEALRGLRSAGCKSFQILGSNDAELLRQIGSLTALRSYYPKHLKYMESVEWSTSLASLAQHHGLYMAVKSILDYAEQLKIFHENSEPFPEIPCETHLLERASIRNAIFYPEEYAGPLPSAREDVQYKSRHVCNTGEASVFDTASMVHEWPSKMNTSTQLFEHFQDWEQLSGPSEEGPIRSLHYDRHWLQVSLPAAWLSIFDLCRTTQNCQYQLLFSLSALAYKSSESRYLIPTLLAFAAIPRFRSLELPSHDAYDLSRGFDPQRDELSECVQSTAYPFESSDEFYMPAYFGENEIALERRRIAAYEQRRTSQTIDIVNELLLQWPCENPNLISDYSVWFNVTALMESTNILFREWFHNAQLKNHTSHVQAVLDEVHLSHAQSSEPYQLLPSQSTRPPRPSNVSFQNLFLREAPYIKLPPEPLGVLKAMTEVGSPPDTQKLQVLLSEFRGSSTNGFHQLYGTSLSESRHILSEQAPDIFPSLIPYSIQMLQYHCQQCEGHFRYALKTIQAALSSRNIPEYTILSAGLWPRITTRSLLEQLGLTCSVALSTNWKRTLVSFANALLLFQRSQRLLALALNKKYEEFFKELENTGCDGWDAMEYPDWLLIQIENHFLIRRIQAGVALEMIRPTSQDNTTLQLNMGEGKSSVIVPIAAAALGGGDKLVRVIVLKSLAVQMFQLLVERLGGLTNRRIFYLPFSRSLRLDATNAAHIQKLYKECLRTGGIWVAQPDHILSYKLMSIDQRLLSKSVVAETLLKSQQWLDKHSRDILDESDEILHVRYQLVYTIGLQNHLEGFPDRWTTMQQLLWLVKRNIGIISDKCPFGVDLQQSSYGGFPPIRILQDAAGTALVSLLAERILEGDLPNYSFSQVPPSTLEAISAFIKLRDPSSEDAEHVRTYCSDTGLWNGVLLLRGLLAKGVLIYVLKERRWRVDYGLDLRRSMLAVPYRAKDVPAPRAEFGHADVAIALTCLSYYYGGLSERQLDICFELLQKSDNPDLEYETWVHEYGLDDIPEYLRHLSGVNTRSTEQRKKYLVPLFRYNQAIIDYYLANVVFPAQAKEFPRKLATSGWDIAERKVHVMTGFSGTNDNRYLLPTSITQHDPPHQLSTNAKVLNYLLQDENNHYLCISGAAGEPLWLSLKLEAQAAIYFNENDELTVLDRDGNVESFVSSPFNQQIDQCLLYLDDAHTRGTDVKLPPGSRAAVTLGPKVTKDRLTQGCMRMRQLGNGHSVMFFAPLEVDRGIREAAMKTGKDPTNPLDVRDILRWVMLETSADVQHRVSQWAEQGLDHRIRAAAWSDFISGKITAESLAASWLQRESWTLEEMYGLSSSLPHSAFEVSELRERCLQLGVMSLSQSRMDEEQEREVIHEVERERQVARPPKVQAAKHQVHKDVTRFITTGIIRTTSAAFKPAFTTLCRTTAEFKQNDVWSPNLLATADFIKTVELQSKHKADDFLRPCNLIISSEQENSLVLIILSPFEVNNLLPQIRRSSKVRLHLYTPRVTKAMKASDNLTLYTVPPMLAPLHLPMPLKIQLNVLAGQLFLPDLETYTQLCRFLGIYTRDLGRNVEVQSDGFIKPKHRPKATRSLSPFTQSPLLSLKALIGLRRKGMGYLPTHLGKILQARLLTAEDFVA
ncbi:hypothetical protein SERLA73DRAFT_65475 [Serpula lacrymans var. lacrymans S7.3]|uniref:ubiquitinyl hydrolase 1 n=1 Tax=Serpula lacrymans var. lacrymans (strain S7.3) TaxID=936435 RepID=F8QGH7_SERL3|nr:hypothetical protein SERLA73DRAFT_65475 [Serpula lacrymans var. lacrymans S7.3]